MSNTTFTTRRFDQDAGAARIAAKQGPVLITERGRPSHVLLSYASYRRLTEVESNGTVEPNIADLLYMPEVADIEFDPPKMNLKLKVPDLS